MKRETFELNAEAFITKEKRFFINKDRFETFNEMYEKEDIKEMMIKAIKDYKIPLPLPKLEDSHALAAFQQLCSFNTTSLLRKSKRLFTKYEHSFPLSENYIKSCNVGNDASNRFHIENRMKCSSESSPSPYELWDKPKKLGRLLNAVFAFATNGVNEAKLLNCLRLKFYIASHFKPVVAKCIYELFDAKEILDISAGWGDRLAGFYAASCTQTYVGFDPNEDLKDGYDRQIEMYNKVISDFNANKLNRTKKHIKRAIISQLPFEKAKLCRKYDLCFTSPPYFDKEEYSDHKGQSFKNFSGFEDWMTKFLFRSIDIAVYSLKPTGFLAINIEDVQSKGKTNAICDRMCEYIEDEHDMYYVGCLGMEMALRPSIKATRKQGEKCIEPIWIFSKTQVTLDEIIDKKTQRPKRYT